MTQTAFVTGATGLPGNNLVHALTRRGFSVRGLARSREKANKAFWNSSVKIVEGDMNDVAAFAPNLQGVDVIFHTAAFLETAIRGEVTGRSFIKPTCWEPVTFYGPLTAALFGGSFIQVPSLC